MLKATLTVMLLSLFVYSGFAGTPEYSNKVEKASHFCISNTRTLNNIEFNFNQLQSEITNTSNYYFNNLQLSDLGTIYQLSKSNSQLSNLGTIYQLSKSNSQLSDLGTIYQLSK